MKTIPTILTLGLLAGPVVAEESWLFGPGPERPALAHERSRMTAFRELLRRPEPVIVRELEVRADKDGFDGVRDRDLDINLQRVNVGWPRKFWGWAGEAPLDFQVRKSDYDRGGRRLRRFLFEGIGVSLTLDLQTHRRPEWVLSGWVAGRDGRARPVRLRFEPITAWPAPDYDIMGGGAELRARVRGPRDLVSGEFDSRRFDALRLAAAGAALQVIRLSEPEEKVEP